MRQTLDRLGNIPAATTTETFMVRQRSTAIGETIRGPKLRRIAGATIIELARYGRQFTNRSPGCKIRPADNLVMLGSHAQLDQAMRRLGDDDAEDATS